MTVAINRITARSISEALKAWETGESDVQTESLIRDSAYILAKLLSGPLDQIHEAIHDPAPHLVHHIAIREKHRREWPTLWEPLDALDSILQDVG